MTSPGTEPNLLRSITACQHAHRRLAETVAGLDDGAMRRASLLPGWTVGHVLTHLARNADAFSGLLQAAGEGRQADMYPGGPDARDAAIEEGAHRSAGAILDDLTAASARLQDAIGRAGEEVWAGSGRAISGSPVPCRLVPARRRREVEVHHVDLEAAYTAADWPADFVDEELPAATAGLARRIAGPGDRAAVLAWLLGRSSFPETASIEPWSSPPAGSPTSP